MTPIVICSAGMLCSLGLHLWQRRLRWLMRVRGKLSLIDSDPSGYRWGALADAIRGREGCFTFRRARWARQRRKQLLRARHHAAVRLSFANDAVRITERSNHQRPAFVANNGGDDFLRSAGGQRHLL